MLSQIIASGGCSPNTGVAEFDFDAVLQTNTPRPDKPAMHWPAWRGPRGTGVVESEEQRPLGRDPLEIRWSCELSGGGNSSPIAVGDFILLTSEMPKGETAVVRLHCHDRRTGEPVWEVKVAETSGSTHRKNGHASSTPACDGERVFVSLPGSGLFGFDLTGRRIWEAPLPAVRHEWGFASSPLVEDGRVIVVCDAQTDSYIAAFDAGNGALLWKTPRSSRGGWTSPVACTARTAAGSERREVIVNGGGGGSVISYDSTIGAELWRHHGTTDIACPTAILGNDVVVSSSGGNGPVFALKTGGSGLVPNHAALWRQPAAGPYVPTGVLLGERLFLLLDSGMVQCFDPIDGALQWKHRLRGNFSASLTALGDQVIALSEQGDLYIFGGQVNRYELHCVTRLGGDRFTATPAIAEGALILRSDRALLSLGPPGEVASTPAAPPVPAIRTSPSDRTLEAVPRAT